MSNRNFAFMRKPGGPIERVPLNEWARRRSQGYEFVEDGEKKFNEQQAKRPPAQVEAEDNPPASKKKKKKKVMRRT